MTQSALPIEQEDAELEHFHDMLSFVIEKDANLPPGKARTLASHFSNVNEFLEAPRDKLLVRSIGGRRALNLSQEQIELVQKLQSSGCLNPNEGISENYVSAISRDFTRRQTAMIYSMKLDTLNPNPFLIQSLDLNTPLAVVKLNVYMAATRSIVTSMGFFVEKLLLSTSRSVQKMEKEWDLLKTDKDGKMHWIQVKSGPNDMDYDQIGVWVEKIAQKVSEGQSAFIGTTYGKREKNTISISMLRRYLPDWELHSLIGRELWDFLSDDPNFHVKLFTILKSSAEIILNNKSITDHIDACVERISLEFIDRYGDGVQGVNAYLDDIF